MFISLYLRGFCYLDKPKKVKQNKSSFSFFLLCFVPFVLRLFYILLFLTIKCKTIMGLSARAVHDWRNKTNRPQDIAPVFIRVILDRNTFYINTEIKIAKIHWNLKKEQVNSNCPNYVEKNLVIDSFLQKIENLKNDFLLNGTTITKNHIKNLFSQPKKKHECFLKFMKHEINNRTDITETTRKTQTSKYKKLVEFHPEPLLFENVTLDFIQNFDRWMKDTKQNSINTRWSAHKDLNTYISRAIKRELILDKNNPYRHFAKKKEETTRESLEQAEIELLENFTPRNESEKTIKDKFLFSCYTGLRISDQNNLTKDNFSFPNENECFLTFKMQKVQTTIRNIPLHDLFNGKAMRIVKEYYTKQSNYLFPKKTDQHTNRVLKEITKELEIKKRVTTHTGRHTFGAMLAEKTNDPILIKTLMGHKKIDTSMIYINMSKTRLKSKLNRIDWE